MLLEKLSKYKSYFLIYVTCSVLKGGKVQVNQRMFLDKKSIYPNTTITKS